MRIVLYCPLNDPDDGGTSGDRRMARQIRSVLRLLGHEVETLVRPRTFSPAPDGDALAKLDAIAATTSDELLQGWRSAGGAPDLWITYHNYHKAPDLLGPRVCGAISMPYVIVEASHTPSKRQGDWARHTAAASHASLAADLHFCFTGQDREGLTGLLRSAARLTNLAPFIDTAPFANMAIPARAPATGPLRLISVAMMRHGWKLDSYRALAQGLSRLAVPSWTLSLVGDGPARAEVQSLFAGTLAKRVNILGLVPNSELPALLASHDLFVWPGLDEPFGLVFLEAQAAGLPVVAFDSGGVGDTVRADETAILVPEGNIDALAAAMSRLGGDKVTRNAMSAAARAFALRERGFGAAARQIGQGLELAMARQAASRAAGA